MIIKIPTKFVIRCKYCGQEHEKKKCSALRKTCSNVKKKYYFQVVYNYKKRIERVEDTDPPIENTKKDAINRSTNKILSWI